MNRWIHVVDVQASDLHPSDVVHGLLLSALQRVCPVSDKQGHNEKGVAGDISGFRSCLLIAKTGFLSGSRCGGYLLYVGHG